MTLIIGHRGASADFPENTIAAFRGASDQGADGVELDVRQTCDGALVVHHDPFSVTAERSGTPTAPTFRTRSPTCATRSTHVPR